MTRRLIREGDPPAGQLASPVPQYWDPDANGGKGDWRKVEGAHGAPRAILYGPNGQPISQSNPLEVRVRELEAELAAMRGMLETGNAKVTLQGSKAKILGSVETIINAQSVEPSASTGRATFDSKGASHVFLLINSDQPWRAFCQSPWTNAAMKLLYPDVSQPNQTPRMSTHYPQVVLYTWAGVDGLESDSLSDAINAALAWESGQAPYQMGISVTNTGSSVATITVRVVRVWRG